LASRGVECVVLNDKETIDVFKNWMDTNPRVWNEDIGVVHNDQWAWWKKLLNLFILSSYPLFNLIIRVIDIIFFNTFFFSRWYFF